VIRFHRRRGGAVVAALVAVLVAACGGTDAGSSGSTAGGPNGESRVLRLYTSFDQQVVDGLLAGYRQAQPGTRVEVFRAPTGQLNARIAAEQRAGGVRADVLLLSDPLSMQQFAAQGLLLRWSPPEAKVVPAKAHTDAAWGVTTSDVVVVVPASDAAPSSWQELTQAPYRDGVAIPDPGFAGSAFGALGYFAGAKGYGIDYYRRLKANGAVQVQAPGDVITGVAEGQYKAGMTLDFAAQAAIDAGSPLQIAHPAPGGIRLYAPVAVVERTHDAAAAKSFAGFLLTKPAQQELSRLGRRPIRADVRAPTPPARFVQPDWPQIFSRQDALLQDYRAVFDG